MPVDLSKLQSDTNKYVAVHKFCQSEAFCYVKNPSVHKSWVGALFYQRGRPPIVMTQEFLDSNRLRCANCGKPITNENEVAIAIEPFSVKAVMRFIDNFSKFVEANSAIAQSHLKLLEYPHLLGMSYDEWETKQKTYEKNLDHLSKWIKNFVNTCVSLGDCRESKKSPLVVARSVGPVPKIEQ